MARSGFEVQKVTVEALFLREIRTRFGKFRLGYLWAILEPSAHLLILLKIKKGIRPLSKNTGNEMSGIVRCIM